MIFQIQDCREEKVELSEKSLTFVGVGGSEEKLYKLSIDLLQAIDVEVIALRDVL